MHNYNAVSYDVIYVYAIRDKEHNGYLKIGKTSLNSDKSFNQLTPNCSDLNYAANLCISTQTHRAMIKYDLLYTELAIKFIKLQDGTKFPISFDDHAVHKVLVKSGFKALVFEETDRKSEWYNADLSSIKKAIQAVKENRESIGQAPTSSEVHKKIVLREEQERNVNFTHDQFKTRDEVLWDCKMRYGKTITAYSFIKKEKYKKVIVVTHRPAVQDGWKEDHEKVFYGTNHRFLDKTGRSIKVGGQIDFDYDRKLKAMLDSGEPFIYFASLQDLRESKTVGGKFNKNKRVFATDWDLIIVDEAHEGTRTEKGDAVLAALKKKRTKVISLTGTAYNLYSKYDSNVFSWTYVDEQEHKLNWEKEHPNERNPYADLPCMNILTFDLAEQLNNSYKFVSEDAAFNFREFFRTWTGDIEQDFKEIPKGQSVGDFVHEDDVNGFLTLISENREDSNYPFSRDEFREMFKHTFWIVPGVAAAKALSSLIRKHPRFKDDYKVVNIAGSGDEEEVYDKALHMVKSAIKSYDKTISISCGRLTTGVTVPEWTAIMLLSGSATSSAQGYMQAIFRVQSPGWINGKRKLNCYAFDFAPDRALKVIADVHRLSHRADQSDESRKKTLGDFLNFCPVIAADGTKMQIYDVPKMMTQIRRISIENAINSGFDDDSIYKSDAGIVMDKFDQEILRKLADVVVPKKRSRDNKSVVINDIGLTEAQRQKAEAAKHKQKKRLTPEEAELLNMLKIQKAEQRKMFNLLRAVSIRLPMMFYGSDSDIKETVRLNDFADNVDDESWAEFMPVGLHKDLFREILKYYDEDVVIAAGLRIRRLARAADELPPSKRAARIFEILSKFKNPDKETVLTPWRVVNMHMGETFGGYNFYGKDNYSSLLNTPRFIDNGEITKSIFKNKDAKILEINSKSGLYPLYIAYTLYMLSIKGEEKKITFEEAKKEWFRVIDKFIYILCKTKMARSITKRTLAGYSDENINAIYLTKLVDERMKDIPRLVNKLTNPKTWGKGGDRMKFKAVVGNPPYQGVNHSQIYPYFYLTSIELGDYVSMIFPTGWQEPKSGNNLKLLNNKIRKEDKQIVKINNVQNVFPGISGAEWVNIILWQKGYDNKLNGKQLLFTNSKDPKEVHLIWDESQIEKPKEINSLANLVMKSSDFAPLQDITSSLKPYGLRTDVIHEDAPEKYGIGVLYDKQQKDTDIKIYCKSGILRYVPRNYVFPKKSKGLNKFKVFVAYAWGNMSENVGLGGAYSDVIIGKPYEACTETYQESGCFDDFETAQKHAKYLLTKFARACLYKFKFSQHSTTAWGAVPIQTYKEKWWNLSIQEIDKKLMDKYNVPENVKKFIFDNFQYKDENNIVNFVGKKPKLKLAKYDSEFNMSYSELVKHLLKKYGPVKYDYFTDESCTVKNKSISKTASGLFCHHIDEDKAIMLSDDKFAAQNPFSYQKANRLVYCNIMEHLLLHIKIAEEPQNKKANKFELQGIGGAVNLICRQINDFYDGYIFEMEYMKRATEIIKDDFEDYIKILIHLSHIIENNPIYKTMYKKEDLAKGWKGNVVESVIERL